MNLTEYGKRLLGSCTPKDSLEHTDASLECTKDLPHQYTEDTGGNAGNSFEFELSDKEQQSIDNLLKPFFSRTLK